MRNRVIILLLAALITAVSITGCRKNSAVKDIVSENTGTNVATQSTVSAPEDESKDKPVEGTGEITQVDAVSSAIKTENNTGSSSEVKKNFPITLEDMLGNKVELPKKPEKIAVISAGLLELFYSAGGKSICTVQKEDGSEGPDCAKELPVIGKASNPDIIGILELEPDVVFAEADLQNETITMLQKNEITIIALKLDNEDNRSKAIQLMKDAAGLN